MQKAGTRYTPGLDKALSFLDNLSADPPVCSVRRLAREAGVSYVTMWKAMRRRSAAAGKHPKAVAPTTSATSGADKPAITASGKERAWMRIASRIQEDLLQNRLPRHEVLPQVKELCARYDAGFRVMQSALAHLCDRGLLQRTGRRYHAAVRSPAASAQLTIAVLIFVWYEGPLVIPEAYDREFLPDFEAECMRRNVRFEIVRYVLLQDEHRTACYDDYTPLSLEKRSDYAGFLVPIWSPYCQSNDLFARLQATGKPVAIIDEIGGWKPPSFQTGNTNALVVRARSYAAGGREAARDLIAGGHRRIAFFSPFHSDVWSQECLASMEAAASEAGCGGAIVPFVRQGSQATNEYLDAALARGVWDPLRAGYSKLKPSLPGAYREQLEPYFLLSLRDQLSFAEHRRQVYGFFSKALSDKNITCWVGADQDTALFAHEFQIARKRTIPLVGFGNSLALTTQRIASWNFNAPAAAGAALEHLLYPKRRLAGQKGAELAIQGALCGRESLRRE